MKLKIRGKKHIEGTVQISGAKNSAVAIIPAATLTDEPITLYNIPDIADVRIQIDILNNHGYKATFSDNTLKIQRDKTIKKINTNFNDNVESLRGSYYFIGSYLSRYKKIKIKSIGGCNLGPRPINYHLDAFKLMNANYNITNDYIEISTKKLKGATIYLEYPSVGTTINIIIASVLAKGKTIIKNAALEPEVEDLGNFLLRMGAQIEGLGTQTITITGVKKLHGCDYTIISDRIEAATYLAIGAISEGDGLTVSNVDPSHLIAVTDILKKMGHSLSIDRDSITIIKGTSLSPVDIITKPYPGFPTDLNPIFAVLLSQIQGESHIQETVFLDRTSHINELNKMGANIMTRNQTTTITGISDLKCNLVEAKDLRCAAALMIASLLSRCTTTIDNIEYLLRGYEKPIEKLKCLNINARIE